ncbi:MAG: radical SAM protein [Acidobacteria bacterium]|nr:MAG: radical SAM protein [Acidobacteriota bacterium]
MNDTYVVRAWSRILQGYQPILSVEITNRCPLSCPGCYAYQPNHVSGTALEQIGEYTGVDLVGGVLELVARHRPLLVSIVGGEPLVRYRELSILLPQLCSKVARVEVVTSAVRPIPLEWNRLENLKVVVSVDGLQPEHDERRKPATYERILSHIEGRSIFVHCTVTGQMTRTPGYIEEFVQFWSARKEVSSIRISLFTPQVGEVREEVLQPEDRHRVVAELGRLRGRYPKIRLTGKMLDAYLEPPRSPDRCIFSQITRCVSSDLQTLVLPCQFGGTPDCSKCGCAATVGFEAVGRAKIAGLRLAAIFRVSRRVGLFVERVRNALSLPVPRLERLPSVKKDPETSEETS